MVNIEQSANNNLKVPSTDQKRLIIIGGGFAGMELARRLKDEPIQVVLIDKNNYHTSNLCYTRLLLGRSNLIRLARTIRKVFLVARPMWWSELVVSPLSPSKTSFKRIWISSLFNFSKPTP